VFLAFVTVLAANLAGSILLVYGFAVAQRGAASSEEVESAVSSIVLEPPVVIGSVALSVTMLLGASLIGAAASPIPMRKRLRLRNSSERLRVYVVAILGLVVAGQTFEYLSIWLGLRDGTSALDFLAKVIASMPGPAFAALLVVGSLGAGIAEELFFRGYMQTRLVERWGAPLGIVLSAAAFGILHFDPLHSSIAFIMGLYLGWLAELRQSILLPIVAHVGNNIVAFVATRLSGGEVEGSVPWFVISAVLALASISWLRTRTQHQSIDQTLGGTSA
jgi:membrane protease YdiL (CAAX protease family)